MKLCLSGTSDYWVNDAIGQPFFVINKVINEGLIQTLKEELLQIFDRDVPNQPNEQAISENELISKYMLVFDREGYSPDLFYDLWEQRIAIATYKKNVDGQWDEAEFSEHSGTLPFGSNKTVLLAERGVLLQNQNSKKKIWVREIRKRNENGHQTSIITTDYTRSTIEIGLYIVSSLVSFSKLSTPSISLDLLATPKVLKALKLKLWKGTLYTSGTEEKPTTVIIV